MPNDGTTAALATEAFSALQVLFAVLAISIAFLSVRVNETVSTTLVPIIKSRDDLFIFATYLGLLVAVIYFCALALLSKGQTIVPSVNGLQTNTGLIEIFEILRAMFVLWGVFMSAAFAKILQRMIFKY